MTTQVTHNDAAPTASTQASLSEFLGSSAGEDPDETTTGGESTIDYSQVVFASNDGNRYHTVQAGMIPGCPSIDGHKTTLAAAVANGDKPCKRCNPIDHREDAADHATEGR
jgi:hypothetical protein